MAKYEISEGQVGKANANGRLLIDYLSTLGPDMPATRIGSYQMMRFVNWLNIVTGHQIAYKFADNGDWVLWPTEEAWQVDGENLYRHRDTFYFMPSWDEWYKAAFYNPQSGTYSPYAYGVSTAPTPLPFPGGTDAGTCVYAQPHDLYGMPAPGPGEPNAHRDWRGAVDVHLAGGTSPYGTVAQSGNVNEFLETAHDGVNDSTSELLMLRGGWWYRPASVLRQGGGDNVSPGYGHTATYHGGFRIAALPKNDIDSDGDGVEDREERIAGTDPNDAADSLRLWISQSEEGLEAVFQTRPAPLYGFMDPQRFYRLEAASDLAEGDWAPIPGFERILGNGEAVSFRQASGQEERRYFRLRAWMEAGMTPQPARGELTVERFGDEATSFDVAFVTVRDEGNLPDPASLPYPVGGVSYAYRIGKYEVSEEQVNKANALGTLGIDSSWSGPKKPARLMDFFERVRFVNWLNTSRGFPPAYNLDERGVWRLWSPEEAWQLGGLNLYRHKDAMFFFPSADEWYKAAFFVGNRYTRYSTASDVQPIPAAGGRVGGTLVYDQALDAEPSDVDDAGGLSYYGTMAQGGNIAEWLETAYDGVNDTAGEHLQIRGGSWSGHRTVIWSLAVNSGRPNNTGGSLTTGFRVAARVVEEGGPSEPGGLP
jgi:hypothetical protein